ncbi:MAG TPA: hypothetical protein DC046_14660, partial [Rhodospirillaceae bacterium]|nr:hypothetical protein [Rhodospirillaceae bacterium]
IGGTVEAGDTLTVAFDTNNDGTPDVTKTITVGANPTLASVRDALVAEIGTAGGMTAAALQDGELVLISNDPNASFIRVTVSTVNEDGLAGEAPTISAARTGTEAALRALKNGLEQASAVASTIEAAVDIAGTAAETARAAANGLEPDSAATIVGTANSLGNLSPALDANVPADVVTAAQLLAEIAEGYVPDALSGAATANAQATIAQQAAFQAASGLAQFEQAILKARNEAELRIQQEARDSAPVAGDDVIGDGDAANGGPVSGDDEVLEDQAITFDVLSNDKRADGGDLTNAAIAAVGQPAHGKISIVAEVRELNFGPAFTDGDKITLTVNGVSVTYTLDDSSNAEGNAAFFVELINGTPGMAAVVSAASAGRGGAITLTSAVPGTPIATSVATQGDVTADADTVTVPNGRVTYTPDANYNGTDTFTYTVSNGATPPSFDTATVTIDITATNDNPDAKNDFITTANDSTALSKTAAAGLLANDTDIDTGDSLSIIKVNGSTVGVAQNVNFTLPNGDPVVAQVTINADGSYTVNPNGQFEPLAAGQSATGTLTYTVSDGHAGTDDQTITLANTVANATGVNQVSTYTLGGTVERGDVFEITVNGTRISHTVTDETTANQVRDAIVAKLNANGAIAGKVAASAGGAGEVVITANLAGQAFTTSAQAINAGTDVATLTVTITGSNDAPTADADTASGDEDTTITGTLTATDPDLGDTLTFAVAGGGQAANGTVTVQSNGNFSYVPNAEFSGTDSFTFRVTDAAGISSTATVTITVNNVNDDPVITAGGDPAPTFEEGGDAVVIDGNIEIADVDTANFNTGYLRAQVTDNLDPGDHLLIQEAGGITLSGSDVLFNGVVIGTIDGTDDGSAANLLITLDADATPAAVQALARTIAFTNDAAEPTTVARTVTFTVDSGDGGTTTQDATVQVALESGLTRSDHDQLNFSGDWFDAANWTSGLPDATTIAVLNDGGYAPITFNNGPVNETVGQLVVNADLNILAGTLNVLAPSSIEQDATVTIGNASVLGTGDLNIAGTVALSGGATLGLPLITLDAAENGGIHGEISITGSGNQIDGALAITYLGGYFGTLALGEAGSGNVALDVTLGIVNDGDIIIDNSDAAPADTILTVGGPGIVNSRNIIFSDTSGGGGQRIIEGSIDTANGTITVDASAIIDLAGGILNAAAGTIELATATVLTVSDGQTVVDSDTYLTGTGTLDLAGTGALTLNGNFGLYSGNAELTLSGAITIEGATGGEGAPTFTIGDGRTLTLDNDTIADTVNLSVDGILNIEGTGTVIAAPTNINSPDGVFNVAPGATVTITAPGFIFNNGGEISVGAGATLILDGANIENTGILTGEGTIQLANGADIAGDGIIDIAGIDNVGTLNITGGEVVFDTNSILDIDIGGGASDVLNLDTMDLTAAGDTLNLNFAPDFDPTTDGNTFQILNYSSHTAEIGGDGGVLEAGIDNIFDTIQHNLGPEYTVTIDYGSTAATVTVNRIPEIAVTTNGAGMQFDGVDDRIVIPVEGTVNTLTSITVEAVITLTEYPTGGARIAQNFGAGYEGWSFTVSDDGSLYVEVGDGGGDGQLSNFTTPPSVLTPGVPAHVAFSYDGPSGDIAIYVNGVDVGGTLGGVDPVNNLGTTTADVSIGYPFPFDGVMDEFRIYDHARTATEVAADAGGDTATGTAPLVHYDFADGTATNLGTLVDSADGILGTSAASGEAEDPLGVPLIGQALSFDGVDDQIVVNDPTPPLVINATDQSSGFVITNATLDGTDDTITDAGNTPGTFAGFDVGDEVTLAGFPNGSNNVSGTITAVAPDGSSISFADGTLGANNGLAGSGTITKSSISPLATGTDAFSHQLWFRTDTTGLRQELFEVLSDGTLNEGALLFVNSDNKLGFDLTGAAGLSGQGPVVADGLWHHAAVTFDGTTTTLYVDGTAIGSTTSLTPNLVSANVNIGIGQGGILPFSGEIFDVRAYDVGRSQADILSDMHTLPDGTDPTLTAAWHLDDVLNGTSDQFRDVTGNGNTGTFTGGTPVFVDNNLFTMAEDSVLHGQIIATDADDVNDTEVFTFGVAAQGANGTVTINGDGTWEYTPNTHFFGTDSFEVQVTDSLGAVATKAITVTVLNVNDAPTVETASGAATFAEDGAPVIIDPALTITDLDSTNFDGGTLTIDISSGYQAGDVLTIDAGAAFDLSSGMTNGSLVSIGQDVIGAINLDGASGTLSIDLTDFATPGVVEQLARAVTFQNDTEEPGAGARGIDFTLTDGDGGTSAILSQTVNITPVNDAPEVTTATLPAGTATFDAEILVNTALTGEQSAADVTYFAGGTKFVAIWNNYSVGGGADLGTIGRIFNADGTPDGPEFIIANTAPGSEYNARVSPMTDGGFIVSYVNQPTAADATTSDLYVQRYDVTGQAVSRDGATPGADAFNVGEYFSGTVQNGGTIVGLSNGGFVIAIDQQDSGIASGQDATARVFGANGLPVTGEFLLGSPDSQGTELAALPGGGFVAVWTDNTDGDNDLFARVYDNSGTPLGAEFAVAVNQGGGTQQDQHEVATLSNGNFAVAWRTDDIASGDNDGNGGIGLRIFGPDGTPVTGDLLANTDITGHQNEPSIAALPDGGFVVSWSTNDATADGAGTAIRAQRFDAAGAKVGTEFTVNENTAGNQQQSAIAADGDGNLVAVFRQSDPVGATADNTEIGARVISFGLDGKTYVEDGAPLVVDSGITLTDIDSATLDGATVTITTAFEANTDILSFTPVGAIGGSYDAATGALTLTGTGTQAEYEQVLRSVTFNSTAAQPDLADRTIEFQVTDDQGAPSTPLAVTIGVENINDAPEISSAGGNATFTEDGPAVAIDTAIDIIDIDSTDFDLGQFTAAITAGGTADDVLDIDTSGNIGLSAGLTPASVVSVSGTDIGLVNAASTAGNIIIDLDPDATPALVQELARAVTYQNISEEPGVAQRTVTFQVSDGDGGASAAFDRTVDISPVNDAPEILGVVQSSNAAQFDGSGDSISLANPAGLPNSAADFTWSAWVKTDATAVNHAILSVGNATGTGTNGQLFIQGSGQLAFDSLNVNFITGGPAINDDAWHHVAVTTSGGYSEIFVDGVSVSAPVDLSLVIGTDSAFIGQAPDGTNQFQGEISDVRIYDVARGVDDIAADMGLRLTGG